ncbi:ParM/StbA family protein [Natronospora cellulosivora (SeqCode)]
MDNLVIELEGNKYFVGVLANRQSNIVMSTLSQNRINSIEHEVLFCTALGLINPTGEDINVVTGLPINEYSDEMKENLSQRIKGTLVFKLNDKPNLYNIRNCQVIPQPFGTIFDQLMDSSGEVVSPDYADLSVGVIDIGFRTSEFTVADKLEYMDGMSSSSNIALSSAYKLIARELNAQFGITKPLYLLDQAIRKRRITIKGEDVNLSPFIEKAFELTAQNIISEISLLWNVWELEVILITSGGGIALYDYLYAQLDNTTLGQFSNVNGYLKMANRNW